MTQGVELELTAPRPRTLRPWQSRTLVTADEPSTDDVHSGG